MDQGAVRHPEAKAGMWEYLSEGKQVAVLLKNLLGLFILMNWPKFKLTFVMAGNEVQQFVSQNETQGLVRWLADKSDDSSLIPKDLHGGPYFPKLSSDST